MPTLLQRDQEELDKERGGAEVSRLPVHRHPDVDLALLVAALPREPAVNHHSQGCEKHTEEVLTTIKNETRAPGPPRHENAIDRNRVDQEHPEQLHGGPGLWGLRRLFRQAALGGSDAAGDDQLVLGQLAGARADIGERNRDGALGVARVVRFLGADVDQNGLPPGERRRPRPPRSGRPFPGWERPGSPAGAAACSITLSPRHSRSRCPARR